MYNGIRKKLNENLTKPNKFAVRIIFQTVENCPMRRGAWKNVLFISTFLVIVKLINTKRCEKCKYSVFCLIEKKFFWLTCSWKLLTYISHVSFWESAFIIPSIFVFMLDQRIFIQSYHFPFGFYWGYGNFTRFITYVSFLKIFTLS